MQDNMRLAVVGVIRQKTQSAFLPRERIVTIKLKKDSRTDATCSEDLVDHALTPLNSHCGFSEMGCLAVSRVAVITAS